MTSSSKLKDIHLKSIQIKKKAQIIGFDLYNLLNNRQIHKNIVDQFPVN